MTRPIRIAVASGKGGTGKTTLSTNLASVVSGMGIPAAYVDCDVEEPNGHLFLAPDLTERREVTIPVPEVDEVACTRCGACGRTCRYSAILVLPNAVLTFPKLCHGCGGCSLACPSGAIREVPREIGEVERGSSGEIEFVHGRLDIGEAMAPPVIRAVLAAAPADRVLVIDAPPGTSCPVIEAVKTADVVLLVTEPTPFGLSDLRLAVDLVRALGLPFGVALNRAGIGDDSVQGFCAAEGIPLLAEIPDDREIARAYARGILATRALPRLVPLFSRLWKDLEDLASRPPVASPPSESITAIPEWSSAPPPTARVGAVSPERVPDLVVVSGKGGTGKTSVVASFSALADRVALADCDVDAADLHLVLAPDVRERRPFAGGGKAEIAGSRCTACGSCEALCRFGAIRPSADDRGAPFEVTSFSCEGCGVCADHCPEDAISLSAPLGGEWFVSDTRRGPMVHAALGVAEENSGRLVSLVRREGAALAALEGRDLLLCDGSPGIGCPVISSLTGARFALIVAEPTVSGLHDLERVAALTRSLGVPAGLCVNKADIDLDMTRSLEKRAESLGVPALGRVRYDDGVTAAQLRACAVVESTRDGAAADIRELFHNVMRALQGNRP